MFEMFWLNFGLCWLCQLSIQGATEETIIITFTATGLLKNQVVYVRTESPLNDSL